MVKLFSYHKLISKQTKTYCTKLIKPVILITSFVTFLYLVINTVNSNALVAKKPDSVIDNSIKGELLEDTLQKFEFYKYNDIFVKSIIKELDLGPSLYVADNGNSELCKINKLYYEHIITSIPGDKLIDFIWEYISVWSLSSELKKLKQSSNIYLTDKTINGLSTLFEIDSLMFSSLQQIPRICLNLELVNFVKSTQIINLNDYVEEVPFVLEKNSKRVFDIISSDLRPLRQELKIQMDVEETVESFFKKATDSMSVKKIREDSYKFVCSYIDENQQNYLPYLKSSIEFHNSEGTSNIFIFMVPPNDLLLYSDEFETSKDERIKVFQYNECDSFNFALLMQCHRTIILNDFTLATALLNAGVATIPKDEPLFVLFKSKMFNWYAISNVEGKS